MATPNIATAPSSHRPTCRRTGRTARRKVTSAAPIPAAARNQPMPTAPTCEAFVGERGEQRDRAAEQDREQVERDRAEHDRLAADEAESLDGFGPLCPCARRLDDLGRDGERHRRFDSAVVPGRRYQQDEHRARQP